MRLALKRNKDLDAEKNTKQQKQKTTSVGQNILLTNLIYCACTYNIGKK